MNPLENLVNLANLPTPIHKMVTMTEQFEGPELYIKRDDMTGVAFSGNKVRKLEYSCSYALDKGFDTLITCGGLQSNHARATAAAAAKLGMKCHLVLGGEKPSLPEGNLFLDRILGASVTYAEGYTLIETEDLMKSIAEDYKKEGFTPCLIPLGASDSTGSLGYIRAVKEMIEQFSALGFEPDHIICPTGSGGTLAGLLAGKAIFGLSSMITGFSVAFDSETVKSRVFDIMAAIKKDYFPEMEIREKDINVNDLYIGEGYTRTTREQLSLIKEVAEKEALIFDPVYTGKAFYGVTQEIGKKTWDKKEKLLFIHTGGVFGLFPYREMINEFLFQD
jgi:D-cysteine desulfhydrase